MRKLIFAGRCWPAAVAQPEPGPQAIVPADGTPLPPRNFVKIVTTGDGRAWTPEPTDASWRDLADLDLTNPEACQAFARRIGDPSGKLSGGRPAGYVQELHRYVGWRSGGAPPRTQLHPAVPGTVVTSQWWGLATALQQAAQAWAAPGADGVSHPTKDKARLAEARDFLDQPAARAALDELRATRDPGGLIADTTTRLDTFLVARAAIALERAPPPPMTRCLVCNSWFEIRRPKRAPRFCSASCRSIHHQQQKETLSHGIGTQEHHAQRDDALASRVERARSGRQHAPAHKKLRPAKRGARARQSHGAGDRRPRRR